MLKRVLAKLDELVWMECKLLSQLSQGLSPFQLGGRYQQVARYPKFGRELRSGSANLNRLDKCNTGFFAEALEALAGDTHEY